MRSSAERRAGDLLLVRGRAAAAGPAPRAAGRWDLLAEVDGWTFRAHPEGEEWTGLPLRECAAGGRRGWLFGETTGDPDAWTRVVEGVAEAPDPTGQFLLWIWDPARRTWRVRTDRFGTLHVYWARRGDVTAVGTCHAAVAAAVGAGELDWTGLTGFFGSGYFPGDRTHYREVRIVRPATELRLGPDRLPENRRTWSWWHAPEPRSLAAAADELGDRLEEVVSDHLRGGRAALPISGGLDSRCLAAAAPAAAPDLWAFSYGYDAGSAETRIARRVAAARALPFSAFVVPAYLPRQVDLALATVEGFQDVTQTRQLAFAGPIGERAEIVLGGHWGDVWLDTLGLEGEAGVTPERAVDRLLEITRKPSAWLDRHLTRPGSGEDPGPVRRRLVAAELADYESIADPDFRIKAFKTDQWSFRWTLASVRAYRAAARPRLPFYDTRLTDFFARLPSDLVAGRRLQIEYLRRRAPDLARIRWQARDADLFGGRLAGAGVLARRAGRKIRRAVLRERVLQRNWEIQFAGPAGRAFLRERLLEPGLAIHDHVAPEAVAALLGELDRRPHDGGVGYQVSILLTFALWLEAERTRRLGAAGETP